MVAFNGPADAAQCMRIITNVSIDLFRAKEAIFMEN